MRLRLVHTGDFRKNEATLFGEAMKANPELTLTGNDCVLLLSTSRKMMKFVFKPQNVSYVNAKAKNGKHTNVMESELYRILDEGTWNPEMLTTYAEEVGIELEGLKRFTDYYRHLLEEEKDKRRKAKKKS